MTEEEWFEFITFGRPPIVSIGRLEKTLCSIIGSATSLVQMRHDYAQKSLSKHGILPQHFQIITWAIKRGIAYQDRASDLTFFWRDTYSGWFQVTIKSSKSGTELWLKTFHRSEESKVKAKLKSVKILRDFKS